jgi:hypothetical protein
MEAVPPEADRGLRRRGHEIPDERSSCTDEYCVASVPVSPRPDFHPDDSDSTELVETWRAKLFGDEGTLNDKMIGAAA